MDSSNSCKAKQEYSCTVTSTSAFSETDHSISSHKRLLAENYAIKFPGSKQTLPASQGICTSDNLDDFKLALKLQHEEMSTPKSSKENLMTSTQSSCKQILIDDDNSNSKPLQQHFAFTDADQEKRKDDNIEFEADAAAALLQLKCHRQSQSTSYG